MKFKFSKLLIIVFMSSIFSVNAFANSKPYCVSIGVDFDEGGVDTSNDAKLFSEDMEDIGFTPIYIDNMKYAYWNDTWEVDDIYLLEADVIMLAGHGNSDGVYFNYMNRGGRYATGVCSGTSQYTEFNGEEYHLAGLNDFDNDDTVLAAFVACNTAKGSYSLTELANMNGINYTLGWKEKILDSDAEKWLDYFGLYLDRYNITDAIARANSKTKYIDLDTITSTQAYVEDVHALNMMLKDYVDEFDLNRTANIKSIKENCVEDDGEEVIVSETVLYESEDDINNIYKYISENIDKGFDSNKFKITKNINNITVDGENVYTAVNMRLKYGDFVSDNGYYVTILNNKVDKIFIEGNPTCEAGENISLINYDDFLDYDDVNEDDLKRIAENNITLFDNESIVNQRILKKFDTEPYYVIISEIEDVKSEIARAEYYEYRL